MLDVTMIREDPEHVRRGLEKRGVRVDLPAFLALDRERRAARTETERLRAERRRVSADVAKAKRAGGSSDEMRARAGELGTRLAEYEARLAELERECRAFLDPLPNLPDDEVAAGGKEHNEVIKPAGHLPEFPFPARDHVGLARTLGLVDYERGTAMSSCCPRTS